MKNLLNRSSFASVISTAIIALCTQINPPIPGKDIIQMATPIGSQIVVVFCIWLFLQSGFDTIEGLREKKAKKKLRDDIQKDIDAIESAIRSGLLHQEDENEKRKELSKKYSDLTNTSVSARK